MKKYFITAALVFISILSFSQQNKLTVGILGGTSTSFLYGFETLFPVNYKPITTASAGLFIQYNFPKTISILSGLSFETKGNKYTFSIADSHGNRVGSVKIRSLYNYMTIPLLVKASFGKKVCFFVEGGGFASYLINASSHASGSSVNDPKTDITSNYKRADAGLAFGLGVTLPVTEKINISLEARDNVGLLNIADFQMSNNDAIKTNSTNFLVSIGYKLGKRS